MNLDFDFPLGRVPHMGAQLPTPKFEQCLFSMTFDSQTPEISSQKSSRCLEIDFSDFALNASLLSSPQATLTSSESEEDEEEKFHESEKEAE